MVSKDGDEYSPAVGTGGTGSGSAGARGYRLDDLSEIAGAAPHRPVTSGEIDDIEVFEVRDLGEHRVARPGQLHHLLARHRAAHESCGNALAGLVHERDRLAEDRGWFRDRPILEPFEIRDAQALETGLLPERVERRERQLVGGVRQVWGEDGPTRDRAGIDPHHLRDAVRIPVENEGDGSVRPTVCDEHHRLVAVLRDHVADRRSLVIERPREPAWVVTVKAWHRDRHHFGEIGIEVCANVVPCPGSQPVAGDEDDGRRGRRSVHTITMALLVDRGVHHLCHEYDGDRAVKRADRLHALTEMLRRSGTRGVSAERLAREFEVSVRTVKRDLGALERSGAPIWSRPGPGGGYGFAPGASLPPITLTPAQAVALMAAVSAAGDAPYSDLAAAGVQKIMDVLDPRTRQRADELANRVWVNAPPAKSRAVRSALEEAMAEQRVVRVRYAARDGATTVRDIEPVLFASTGGRWYLVGWCRLRNAMRWFALSRVEKASVTRMACSGHTVREVGEPPEYARSVHGHTV